MDQNQLINRDLTVGPMLPFFCDTYSDAEDHEYDEENEIQRQMARVEFSLLNKEEKIIHIRRLINQKDIRGAVFLGIHTPGLITRCQKFTIMGRDFQDKDIIACSDMNKKGLFYGQIQHLVTFNFFSFNMPYIQIQIILDAESFMQYNIQKSNEYLKIYSKKELIITDQYTFISLKQILQKINLVRPNDFFLFSQERKLSSNWFYNRYKFYAREKKLKLIDQDSSIRCSHCDKILDPMLLGKICQICGQNYLHYKCYETINEEKEINYLQWKYLCTMCNWNQNYCQFDSQKDDSKSKISQTD